MHFNRQAYALIGAILVVLLTVVGTRTYSIFQEIKMLKAMELVLDRFPRSDLNEGEEYSLELSSYLVDVREEGLRSGFFSGFCCKLIDLYDRLVN